MPQANIINVENITKSYTGRELFSKASFYVQEGEKIGIVGVNGTGKSTLLKIIAGIEEPEEGRVIKSNFVVMNYLPQSPDLDIEKSVIDNVMKDIITTDMDEGRRWALESDARALLLKLGIRNFEQKVGELSGGQKKCIALVGVLLKPCDVLLLDEPTNHLDYDMVEWLEQYLRNYKGAILMVTHDRYFLDSVCDRIVEIDHGSIYRYDTSYSGFLELKTQREQSLKASERKRQSILRKEIEWMRRGARARSTKQKAHIQRYEALRDQKGPRQEQQLQMSSVSTRLGRTTVELKHLHKGYGNRVLVDDFSYIFLKKDRIGFVGKNGCGKTTLMKMIAGFVMPDSGSIEIGQTVKLGYYGQEIVWDDGAGGTQERGNWGSPCMDMETVYMDPNQTVIEYIKDTAEYVRTGDGLVSASAMLERFLFPPEQQYSLISKLSGGERRRLNLLRVLMEAPNVMILDEPTNDLDTQTMAILEDYLDSYEGIVITVSHDRYFLDRIVQRIFAFEDHGKITQYEGGYTDYLAKRPEQAGGLERTENAGDSEAGSHGAAGRLDKNAEEVKDSKATWGHAKKLKFTYKEQQEYQRIEADIEQLEERIESLEREMTGNARDFVKLNELTNEKEKAELELEKKLERWEYLEELAQRIKEQGQQ